MLTGPIIIIDDDSEDQMLLANAIANAGYTNHTKKFSDGEAAFAYLAADTEHPFLIFCDMKMPKMDGLELRDRIAKNERLKRKSIPFVFITGSADANDVKRAYELNVQGFFTKPNSVERWERQVRLILDYWSACIHPNRL